MATTNNELCPVATGLSYLVRHSSGEAPLFQFSDGSPLTRAMFMLDFHRALSSAGVQADGYTLLISDLCSYDRSSERDSRQVDTSHGSVDQRGIPRLTSASRWSNWHQLQTLYGGCVKPLCFFVSFVFFLFVFCFVFVQAVAFDYPYVYSPSDL